MYEIGDKIMYGASGVMTVVDLREETVGDVSRSYYVLRPTLARSDSFTFVPADSERLISSMHCLMTADEVNKLLKEAREVTPENWITSNRARQDAFKKILESGDRYRLVAMINAINECGRRREAEGKKNFLADEGIKAKAERLLYSEIAVVLDIPEEDARKMLLNAI